MVNKRTTAMVIFIAVLILGSVFVSSAIAEESNFTVTYEGVTYNDDGSSTWNYSLKWNGKSPELSHFTIELGECAQGKLISASPAGYEFGRDGSTGLFGIKWEYNDNFPANEPVHFSFRLNGEYEEDSQVSFAAKAGRDFNMGKTTGPSRSCAICPTDDPGDDDGDDGDDNGNDDGDDSNGDGDDNGDDGDDNSNDDGNDDGNDDNGDDGDDSNDDGDDKGDDGDDYKPGDEPKQPSKNDTDTVTKPDDTTKPTATSKTLPFTGMNGWGLLAALLMMVTGVFIYSNSRHLSELLGNGILGLPRPGRKK